MKAALCAVIAVTMVLGSPELRAKEPAQARMDYKKAEGRSSAVRPEAEKPACKVTDLYKEVPGTNPSFKELIDKGRIVVGSKNGKPISGTIIDVNNRLLESNMDSVRSTVRPSSIHTHVKSGIRSKDFSKWSRWYQEDCNTQIFRLFKGEQSVRSKNNIKAGRIEAVKSARTPKPSSWVEWQGTYTIIKASGCIFQLMCGANPETGAGGLWAVHIDASTDGKIFMTRRRPKGKGKGKENKKVLIADNAIGKNVTVKVRFDGKTQYEVYRKIHGKDDGFVFVGKGSYHLNYGDKVGFRWGIYQGSKPGSSIRDDCLLFVTGVKISYTDSAQSTSKADRST